MRALVFAFVLMLSPSAAAQTAEQLIAIERASRVGRDLYDHDRAAWLATDAMLRVIADPGAAGLRGWVTERTDDGSVLVLFVRPNGEELRAAYRAVYRDEILTHYRQVDVALSDAQRRLYLARSIALHAEFDVCAERINTVTLPAQPSPEGSDVDVYIMPASSEPGVHLFGGYFRRSVDTSTQSIRVTQRYTNTCLAMRDADLGSNGSPEALVVSQAIGDTPTEVHVFQSLSARLPVYVSTSAGIWSVNGSQIELVQPEPAN